MLMENFKQVFFQKHKTVFKTFSMDYTVYILIQIAFSVEINNFGHNCFPNLRFLLSNYLYELLWPSIKFTRWKIGNAGGIFLITSWKSYLLLSESESGDPDLSWVCNNNLLALPRSSACSLLEITMWFGFLR